MRATETTRASDAFFLGRGWALPKIRHRANFQDGGNNTKREKNGGRKRTRARHEKIKGRKAKTL